MCGFVWSVYMFSAPNCQTPYKKLTRIVKGPYFGIYIRKVQYEPSSSNEILYLFYAKYIQEREVINVLKDGIIVNYLVSSGLKHPNVINLFMANE